MHCPICQHPVDGDRDFCPECGEYIRWDPTGVHPRVQAVPVRTRTPRPAALRPAPSPQRRDSQPPRHRHGAQLTVWPTGTDREHAAAEVAVEAGGAVELRARIRNSGSTTQGFELAVSGLPGSWWSISPRSVDLNPYGSEPPWEAELEIRLHPPRDPTSEARTWPIEIVACAPGSTKPIVAAPASLRIEPYLEFTLTAAPERRAGRRRACFDATVSNRANAPVALVVEGTDEEQACGLEFAPSEIHVGAGSTGASRLTVRPPRPIIVGRPVERRLSVCCRAPGGPPTQPAVVVYRQRPWLPWWIVPALALLAVTVALAIRLAPHPVAVPDVRGAPSVHAAAARLAAAHLQVWAKGRVDPHVDPGTVIAQFPRPGARVPRDTPITIVDATGSKQRTVPDLSGKTPAQADAELRHLGLALGTIQPDAAAFDAPIRAQIPAAGQRARVGTPVNVSIRPGTSPRPDGVVSGAGVLPATPTPTLTPATPHGSAASTSVFAFDNGRDVFVSRRGSVSAITHESGAHRAVEPALSPDGRYVAYVTLDGAGRGRLWLAGLRGARTAATPLAITGDLHRPAFSPDGRALAFIRKTSLSGGRLCLVTGAGSRPKVRCLPRGGWAINRPAWSPSGHAIAATATRGTATAVVTYRASGRRWALTQTQVMLLGARSVAWLSDGAHVAAIGYGDGYHLYLLGADPRQGLSGDIHPLSVVHGCTVSAAAGGAVAVSVWDCVEARDASIVLVSPDAPETQRVIGHGFDPAFPAPRRG